MTTRLTKPIAREIPLGSMTYVVTLDRGDITFREKGRRRTIAAPLSAVVKMAERLSGLAELQRRRDGHQ